MLIRTGVASIKYSHDAEAAFAGMRAMREFAFLSDAALQNFIAEAEGYSSQDYWHNPEFDAFQSVQMPLYGSTAHLQRVRLYNFAELTRRGVQILGFSCLYCRCHTPHEPSAMAPWAALPREIEQTARARQSVHCALLLCAPCGRGLSVLCRGDGDSEHFEAAVMFSRLGRATEVDTTGGEK